MIRILLSAFIVFLFAFCINAQQNNSPIPGKISGRCIDSISGTPVEDAVVSIISALNGKILTGTITDKGGLFSINSLKNGSYKVIINAIDYKNCIKNNIVINNQNHETNFGDIILANRPTMLNEVTITSQKQLIENKIDKMVYSAERDITSQGSVATDVLKKIPQVDVDVNGNVELQGNSNVLFLIDGKPSVSFGNNIADVLQSIPASQIQSIEIITNPGAKYDAEGVGIINIILKKSTAKGTSGTVSVTGGTRLENGSVNITARKGNFGASAFVSGNAQLLSKTINSLNRISKDTVNIQFDNLIQNGNSNFNRNGFQTGINFNWDVSAKDNISTSLSYNYLQNSNTGYFNQQSITMDENGNTLSDIYSNNIADSRLHTNTYDWGLNYKRKFTEKGQELEVLLIYSNGNNYSNYNQLQSLVSTNLTSSGSFGNNPGFDKQLNLSINYTQPVFHHSIFETGAKSTIDNEQSSSDVYLLNTSSELYNYSAGLSESMLYRRYIGAYYVSLSFKLLNIFDVKTGCREEYTTSKADFSNSGKVDLKPYNTVVQSGVISYLIDSGQTIKFGFSRRIKRPNYNDLDPFVNASDPKNISTGNINLEPEISNQFELGYNMNFKNGTNINIVMFYRGNHNDIQNYTEYFSTYKIGDSIYNNVSVNTRKNMGLESNAGINFYVSVPINNKVNIRSNISCFHRYINTGLPDGNVKGFMYRINVNGSYQLTSSLRFELFGNFSSSKINAQGKMPAFTVYNLALRQELFHKKGSLALTATNPFNQYVIQKSNLKGTGFITNTIVDFPYRSFGINFTYKFGKIEFKKQNEIEDINLTSPSGSGD
jgi:outer membrane receptor protein involved in Fe transport